MRNNIGYDKEFVEKLNKYGICVNYQLKQVPIEDKFTKIETYEFTIWDYGNFAKIRNSCGCAKADLINANGTFNHFSFEELIEILKIIDDKIDDLNKAQSEQDV